MAEQLPGFLAVAGAADNLPGPSAPGVSEAPGVPALRLWTWGLSGGAPAPGRPLRLSGTDWAGTGPVPDATLDAWLAAADSRLATVLPPFAALGVTHEALTLASDALGFRQLFVRRGPAWTALSTSARTLAGLDPRPEPDRSALMLQSVLGWQVGQSTVFAGVTKLEPGTLVRLPTAGATEPAWEHVDAPALGELPPAEAVRRAAAILRAFVEAVLDVHPGAALQLTGGQDSRLVLSAIPRQRRLGLRVLTMGSAGDADVEVAAALAARDGMVHTVQGLGGLEGLTPAECYERTLAAALRLDGMADPLAKAVTLWAEEGFPQGPRLSGLGGEIARGFYYTGRVRPTPVTEARARRLAAWRMFANEAVQPEALDPRFAADARPYALDLVRRTLAGTGLEWFAATDELYLRHRMQRWAGLSESAVCFDRQILNPLLDPAFLAVAAALEPPAKAQTRFLARLQVELDEDLAALPLDNRPPPDVLARRGPVPWAHQQSAVVVRAVRKVRQRVAGRRRSPAGAAVLARGVVRHLRQDPALLDPVRGLDVFREDWLDALASGRSDPPPATVAFLINLLVSRTH